MPRAAAGDLAIEHGQEALGIGRVARLDDDIEDQAALAGGEVELVSVLHVTAAFDDDVGMRLEQADQLLAGRHRLAFEDPALALGSAADNDRPGCATARPPSRQTRPALWRPPVTRPQWPGRRRSTRDRVDASCPGRGCIRSRAPASWPDAGDRATAPSVLPAVVRPGAAAAS